MKKILLSFSFLVLAIVTNAQTPTFEWAKRIFASGSMVVQEGKTIVVDSANNVLIGGAYSGTVDFDPAATTFNLTSAGFFDIFISKYDSLGNFLWAKSIGGTDTDFCTSLALDKTGNVLFTGFYKDTVDFDPGAGTNIMTSVGDGDLYVAKLDTAGNFVWSKSMGGALYDIAESITVDTAGNVYSTGCYSQTGDFDPGPGTYTLTNTTGIYDMYISKLDMAGNFVWARKLGGPSTDTPYSIAVDVYGNVYTAGIFKTTADFDPGVAVYNLTSVGGSDMFVSKLDISGNFLWAKRMGGGGASGVTHANGIAVDSWGSVYTTGYFGSTTADFDPGPGTYTLTCTGGASNLFISKLDYLGNFVWANKVGTASVNHSNSIIVDGDNNVYVTGGFNSTGDFDFGAGVYNLTSLGNYDIFISKYDSNANLYWALRMGNTSSDGGHSLSLDKNGNVYTFGWYSGTVDFDPGTPIYNLTAGIGDNFFIHKLKDYNLPNKVWPGDVDNNYTVDNNDLLPIGLYYGQTGTPRSFISNIWQAYNSADWGILQASGDDIKHVDCNGDGVINNNDTLAVNLNFALTHAFAPTNNEMRLSGPDLHFVTSSSSYLSGSIVDVEVWAGNSTTPVSNLYGIAFDINYDASLVQPATESITYPTSWLGTPGTDAITIAKIDALANTAYGAETRINHTNISGFGKIADFKFQLKPSIPVNTIMSFSISGYQANDSTGTPVLFNTLVDSIVVNPMSVGVSEINNETQVSVYPNPTNASFNVFISKQIKNGSVEIYNSVGELIFYQKIINQQNTIDLKNQASGLYFVKVISDGEVIGMKKVVKE